MEFIDHLKESAGLEAIIEAADINLKNEGPLIEVIKELTNQIDSEIKPRGKNPEVL